MPERCPLSSLGAPGFAYGGELPLVCNKTCESLWDAAVKTTEGDYESYVDAGIVEDVKCSHPNSEYSHDSLQAVSIGSAARIYTIVESCLSCDTELEETQYKFECTKP